MVEAENPSGTIDYDSLTRGKLCPLKGNRPPVLAFWNLDPAPDVSDLLRAGVIKCRADGEPPRVEYIGGQCDGPRCAWWDADKDRCAVLSMARNKRQYPGLLHDGAGRGCFAPRLAVCGPLWAV